MKKIFLLFLVLFFGVLVWAQEISSYKLDNGQNVVIKEVHDNPIVIIDTWIKTGSINETDENSGVAHFLEHLFFKGTSKHPSKEFDNILESKGAITNAATSKDYTHYYILIPSEFFELALDLHSDMLLNPLIPRKEMEKERKVVIEEIAKNNDKPTNILYRNMIQSFYKSHPYKRDVIGNKDVIETISREQVLDFYDKWYIPQNMTTVVIGDIDTQKALDLIKTKFSQKTEASKKIKPIYKVDKKPSSQIEKKEIMDIETGYILIGFKGSEEIDNSDSYALDVLSAILGDGKSSRLYKSLKEQKHLVYSVYSANSSMKDDSIFYISANYTTNDLARLKEAIFSEIDKIKKDEIPASEIQKAKNMIERDTFYSRESISNIASEIGYTVTVTDDMSYYKNYLDNINKVTADDLKRVARTYLDENSAVISVISPSKTADNVVKKDVKKDYKATVVSKKDNTVKYLLENGATLIITNNTSNDIVALEMSSKGGNNVEKIPGVASITAELVKKGTQKYTKQELSELLEDNGIRIGTASRGDSFSIEAKFTKNQKDIALDILKEISVNAQLDNYEFDRVKTDILTAIKNKKNNPDTWAFDEFKTALWQNTAYGRTGKILEKTLNNIQNGDVIEFYKNLFPAQNTVITINGNVCEQDYINYFSTLLTNNNKGNLNVRNYANQYKPLLTNKIVKINKDSQASWLIFGWLTDGVDNQKDWAALQVIDSILGTGMSSRLFTNLRDNQSLAYQVGSSFSANINKGVFAVYIATNPNSTLESKKGILNEIDKLKKEFVTDKELAEAKDKLLGNFILSMETNMEKASVINSLELSDRGYDFINKYPELIKSVTVQDVIKTANKYFSKPYVFTSLGTKSSIDKL